jgi:MoaA/NifB/PqqE/SkfB family radical SAM enzyme
MCVLGSHNVHQVSEIVDLAEDLGVYLVFQPYHQIKSGESDPKSTIGRETVDQLHAMKDKSSALLSSRNYLTGIQTFCQGTTLPHCQAGEKYFSVDPFGYLHPCVDGPRVGHILHDDLSVVRSPQAMEAVSSCAGCWYCFRGEADSTLSFSGYAEKLRLAASILVRNARRHALRNPRPGMARQQEV